MKLLHETFILKDFLYTQEGTAGNISSSTKFLLDKIFKEEVKLGVVQDRVKPSTPTFGCWVRWHSDTVPWI